MKCVQKFPLSYKFPTCVRNPNIRLVNLCDSLEGNLEENYERYTCAASLMNVKDHMHNHAHACTLTIKGSHSLVFAFPNAQSFMQQISVDSIIEVSKPVDIRSLNHGKNYNNY